MATTTKRSTRKTPTDAARKTAAKTITRTAATTATRSATQRTKATPSETAAMTAALTATKAAAKDAKQTVKQATQQATPQSTKKQTAQAVAGKPKRKPKPPRPAPWKRVARPDAIDFRDRRFSPNIAVPPAPTLYPGEGLPVKHQGDTNACTGFGLSLVVEHLLRRSGRPPEQASPYMLYSMARRYDEYPGSMADEGSSLRGALKGWFKHGACNFELFKTLEMPPATDAVEDDWWYDAVKRPLGAYYRITPEQLGDMHAALNEVGVLYVSCGCHSGWDEGIRQPTLTSRPASIDKVWEIPVKPGAAAHAGHAFAIVGYNERGFLVQNSWGTDWGSYGYAILAYDDWLKNAMDCWVAQLGVVTAEHRELSHRATLKMQQGKVALAASEVLRNREIAPFVVNMGNNGALSNSGDFRTSPDDVKALAGVQLERARAQWGLEQGTVDVCIYAHGGLVSERSAANIAAKWVPLLYENHIFPVFLMWETGFVETLTSLVEDKIKGVPRTTAAGLGLERWWNQRLERALSRPGTALWGEMKQNADMISLYRDKDADGKPVPDDEQAGAVVLYRHFKHHVKNKNVRLHLVGHSAGAIVASLMLWRMCQDGMTVDSVSFMAPAVRQDTFEATVKPLLASGKAARYQQFSLTDKAEEDDPSCGAYRRSLLYLVSESFEGGQQTAILGMERYAKDLLAALPNATAHWAPGPRSGANTHGGFDDDAATMKQVVKFILGK